MASIGILTTLAAIVLLEAPALYKARQKKELWVFGLILLASTGLAIAQSNHMPLPNPADWLLTVFKPFGDWMNSQK